MTKQVTEVKSVLTTRAQRVIAQKFCEVMAANDNNGSLLTTVCKTAQEFLHGKPFERGDMNEVVDVIASTRKWKPETREARASEVRCVLASYVKLPEAIKIAQRSGTCNYHFAIKLARKLKDAKSAEHAVKAARVQKESDVIPIEGRIASLLRKLFKDKRSKRDAAMKAWDVLGLKGDIAKAK